VRTLRAEDPMPSSNASEDQRLWSEKAPVSCVDFDPPEEIRRTTPCARSVACCLEKPAAGDAAGPCGPEP